MYFEDDIPIPPLIPIRQNKKKIVNIEQSIHPTQQETLQLLAKQFERTIPQNQAAKIEQYSKPSIAHSNLDEYEKKYSNMQEKGSRKNQPADKASKSITDKKEKELQKAKFIVTDVMKKINAKNIAEELNPITNQAILRKINQMDSEIENLKIQVENKQNSLITNPNNQLLRNELNTMKGTIDKCVTIKQLYNQKINLRNKVCSLQHTILTLREENENLKIKIHKDAEENERSQRGQLSIKEIELREQLKNCKVQLKNALRVKQKLQNNVTDVIHSFQRLYEEADTARLIVVSKLRQIQLKERYSEHDHQSSERKSVDQFVNEDKFARGTQNRDTSNVDHNTKLQKLQQVPTNQKGNHTKPKGFSLEDQIRKMKSNQMTIKKYEKR